ncbi:hypothetical protein, conserved [Angomonas deanei]|uniref:Uncharacterized protein n=1 Tax=Angomonas deanei TaxID=59799 RepID=A0A7G2BZ59_9TRYP|nr:hypothetical protein, conserved [Angomonas deanei]
MSETVPAAFFTQWIALEEGKSRFQQQVMEGAIKLSELRQENKILEEKFAELKQDYTDTKKKYTELQKNHTDLQAMNDALKREIDELKEEKHDYAEEMKDICDRQKNELEEALKDIARMKKEHSDYEREMTASIEKIRQELAVALETRRDRLLDKYYDLFTCQCDLIGLYKYCKAYRVPEDVRRSVLAEDSREELTLPVTLEDDIRGGSLGEFLEWTVEPLPKLATITGYFDSVETCYVLHKQGIVPLSVLGCYCAGCDVKGEYYLTRTVRQRITAVGTCSEYMAAVLPFLPDVTSIKLDDYEVSTPPEDRRAMIGGGSVGEFLTTVAALVQSPRCISGFLDSVEDCYVRHKRGIVPLSVLKCYCIACGVKGEYHFTKETLLTVTAVGTCSEYMTAVLPFLPCIGGVTFDYYEEYTLPEDRRAMMGGGSVGVFLSTVAYLLPKPKNIRGFYMNFDFCYLDFVAGDISPEVLRAFCYGDCMESELHVCFPFVLSAGVEPREYCKDLLPLLPSVTTIRVGELVETIDWCTTLPERITMMDVRYCSNLKDFSPLLKMKQLSKIVYHVNTNPSFKAVIGRLRNKGVTVVEERW